MLDIRKFIIYLAVKYQGDWDLIYSAIKEKEEFDEDEIERTCIKVGEEVITIIDEDYPFSLKKIYKPPFVLFYRGNKGLLYLYDHKYIAFVGSRDVSSYAEKATRKIISDLEGEKVVIISGLAKGVDVISHKACLDHRINTIAILGTGIDRCYPIENLLVYERLKKEGLILSEYAFNNTIKDSFPKRNRIIAGLASSLVVCEAKERSGTLITVNYALNQGKEVYSIPSSIFEDSCNNELISDGATILKNGKDLL